MRQRIKTSYKNLIKNDVNNDKAEWAKILKNNFEDIYQEVIKRKINYFELDEFKIREILGCYAQIKANILNKSKVFSTTKSEKFEKFESENSTKSPTNVNYSTKSPYSTKTPTPTNVNYSTKSPTCSVSRLSMEKNDDNIFNFINTIHLFVCAMFFCKCEMPHKSCNPCIRNLELI